MDIGFTVGGVDPEGFATVRDPMGIIIARFPFSSIAQAYCQWRNNPTPQPKFAVGDRVRFVDNRKTGTPAMTITEHEIRYRVGPVNDHDNSTYAASALELAPPEPRATVKQYGDMWRVDYDMGGRNFLSCKEAEYIAAGLNEHPDWRL